MGAAVREPLRGRLALDLSDAVGEAGGSMFAAGRWRWGITGPCGTIVVKSRSTWPHRKLRGRIRERTGIRLPAGRT